VNVDLSDEALEFGRHARRALDAAGGDLLVQHAEREPSRREALVTAALDDLGAWDLDARGDVEELEAAAALCRNAGWWAAPYPVAERLAGAIVVDGHAPTAALDGCTGEWPVVTLEGRRGVATALPASQPPRKSAFVTELRVESGVSDVVAPVEVALALVLPCWTLLGMLDRAIATTCEYVREREQFGQPLASFQGVQFQLTDAEVERAGVDMLAKHALWSIATGRDGVVADALALRATTIDAAEVVFRTTHQLHGAIGFCDETFLSWLSRHSQPPRRLPFGCSATRAHLTGAVGRHGLSGLFDDAAAL
jgi:hypothetical protein